MFEDDRPSAIRNPLSVPLDHLSVHELQQRLDDLAAEIVRTQGVLDQKKQSRAAADSVFGASQSGE